MPYQPTDWKDGETDLDEAHMDKIEAGLVAAEEKALKGQPNGYASLGADGTVPPAQLPAIPDATPPATTDSLGAIQLAGDLTGTATSPQIAASAVTDAEVAAANKDGAAATPSLRTLGTGAQQAAAGNDSRLSDSRPPGGNAGGDLSGTYPNPQIAPGAIVDADVAAANKDGAAGTPSLRTLGTGANQATAGNDSRLTNARAPTAHATTHQPGGADAMAVDAAVATGSLRTLGAGAQQAMPGNRTLDAIPIPVAQLNLNGQLIRSLATPTAADDAANKQYVDNVASGLDAKQSVKAATTANIPDLGNLPATIDGVAIADGDRVLVKDQTTPAQNGIYRVILSPPLMAYRAADADAWTDLPGAYVFVEQGTAHADTGWVCTADQGGTLGTTPIAWTQFSGAGGGGGGTYDYFEQANDPGAAANEGDIWVDTDAAPPVQPGGVESYCIGNGLGVAAASGSFTLLPMVASPDISSSYGSPDFVRNADGSVTVVQAGLYDCMVYVVLPNSAGQWEGRLVYKVGATPAIGDATIAYEGDTGAGGSYYPSAAFGRPVRLAADTRIALYFYHTYGGSPTIGFGSMSIVRLGSGPYGAPQFVTSLPSSPTDGQEIYYLADATNGVIWHLRYRAGSASAYKWELVGGPPLIHEVPTDQGTASTTFADLATPGPQITVPLAGDYLVSGGFRGYSGSANITFSAAVKIGAAAAANAQMIANFGAAGFTGAHAARTQRLNALAAATVLKMQYSVSAGTVSFVDRWMNVLPVRVG